MYFPEYPKLLWLALLHVLQSAADAEVVRWSGGVLLKLSHVWEARLVAGFSRCSTLTSSLADSRQQPSIPQLGQLSDPAVGEWVVRPALTYAHDAAFIDQLPAHSIDLSLIDARTINQPGNFDLSDAGT